MTNLEFSYWLQGFYELSEHCILDVAQISLIKRHADLVQSTEGTLDHAIQWLVQHLTPLADARMLIEHMLCVVKQAE